MRIRDPIRNGGVPGLRSCDRWVWRCLSNDCNRPLGFGKFPSIGSILCGRIRRKVRSTLALGANRLGGCRPASRSASRSNRGTFGHRAGALRVDRGGAFRRSRAPCPSCGRPNGSLRFRNSHSSHISHSSSSHSGGAPGASTARPARAVFAVSRAAPSDGRRRSSSWRDSFSRRSPPSSW
jgi:hypothetical protein